MPSAWRRCLEGLFDTYGAFGRGFTDDLERGGPKPYGARKANLSTDALPYAQEIALQEQVRFCVTAGQPCPKTHMGAVGIVSRAHSEQ